MGRRSIYSLPPLQYGKQTADLLYCQSGVLDLCDEGATKGTRAVKSRTTWTKIIAIAIRSADRMRQRHRPVAHLNGRPFVPACYLPSHVPEILYMYIRPRSAVSGDKAEDSRETRAFILQSITSCVARLAPLFYRSGPRGCQIYCAWLHFSVPCRQPCYKSEMLQMLDMCE